MNSETIFTRIQCQLTPSAQAEAALRERMEAPAARRSRGQGYAIGCGLAAACLLLVAAIPALTRSTPLHSFERVEGTGFFMEMQGVQAGTGASGIQGGAATGDVSVGDEEAVLAYERLMEQFAQAYGPGAYPDWFGGAYLPESGGLMVCVVEEEQSADKSLPLQVWEWAGSRNVGFREVKYSLSHLDRLQEQVTADMSELGVLGSCRVDVTANRLALILTGEDEKALARLAQLDPAGDAIFVGVAGGAQDLAAPDVIGQDGVSDTAGRTATPQPGGVMPGGAIVGQPEDGGTEDKKPALEEGLGEYDILAIEPTWVEDDAADLPTTDAVSPQAFPGEIANAAPVTPRALPAPKN